MQPTVWWLEIVLLKLLGERTSLLLYHRTRNRCVLRPYTLKPSPRNLVDIVLTSTIVHTLSTCLAVLLISLLELRFPLEYNLNLDFANTKFLSQLSLSLSCVWPFDNFDLLLQGEFGPRSFQMWHFRTTANQILGKRLYLSLWFGCISVSECEEDVVVIMRLNTCTGLNTEVVILNSGVVLVLKLKCM